MLKRTGFLDSVKTRAVIVSFTTYNTKRNLYVSTNILFEKSDSQTYNTMSDYSKPFQLPRTNVRFSVYTFFLLMVVCYLCTLVLIIWTLLAKGDLKHMLTISTFKEIFLSLLVVILLGISVISYLPKPF
jgi:hypothetical protein